MYGSDSGPNDTGAATARQEECMTEVKYGISDKFSRHWY